MLEGSAFGLRDILEAMVNAGLDVRRLTIVGGGAKGPLWRQIKADVTGLPVRVPASVETTATGAAILAAVGSGVHSMVADAVGGVRRLPPRRTPARPGAARDLRRRVPALPRRVFRVEARVRRRLASARSCLPSPEVGNIRKLFQPLASREGVPMADPKTVIEFSRKHDTEVLDLRFTDIPGLWHHVSYPIEQLTEASFEEGFGIDGSSIRAWAGIHESDMLLKPDASCYLLDPFPKFPRWCWFAM